MVFLFHTCESIDGSNQPSQSNRTSVMKLHPVSIRLAAAVALALSFSAFSQERVYRCGNEYTNNAEVARTRGCKPIDGGNVTVIQSTQPARNAETRQTTARATPRSGGGERVDPSAQRARDSDARAILDAELRKAQERLAQAEKAYANGAPEKEGIEFRNHQRYLDRVAELKAAFTRAQGDVESIRREMGRLSGTPVTP